MPNECPQPSRSSYRSQIRVFLTSLYLRLRECWAELAVRLERTIPMGGRSWSLTSHPSTVWICKAFNRNWPTYNFIPFFLCGRSSYSLIPFLTRGLWICNMGCEKVWNGHVGVWNSKLPKKERPDRLLSSHIIWWLSLPKKHFLPIVCHSPLPLFPVFLLPIFSLIACPVNVAILIGIH